MDDEDIRVEKAKVRLERAVKEFNKKMDIEWGYRPYISVPTTYKKEQVLFAHGNYPNLMIINWPTKISISLDFEEGDYITKSQINNVKVEVRENCHVIITGEKIFTLPGTQYLTCYIGDDRVIMAKFGREVVLPFDIELKDIKRQNIWDIKERYKLSPFASGKILLEILKTNKELIRQEPIVLY